MTHLPPAEILQQTRTYVQKTLAEDATGHDWWHVERVTHTAKALAKAEGADSFTVELAALLHDIADWKFHGGDQDAGPKLARAWLEKLSVNETVISEVEFIVRHISFRGGTNKTPMRSLEGQIVQDADRLDAIGAIGIARTFAFGGSRGRPLYHPQIKPKTYSSFESFQNTINENTTINHFYEKLLLIKDRMNTPSGQKLAQKRHQFLELFLDEFYAEWRGAR